MKNKFYSKFFYRVSIILVVVSMFPLFFISRNLFIAFTQTINGNDKTLTKETFKNEPVEIVNLKTNGKDFQFVPIPPQENKRSKDFKIQENDWFKDFTIAFRNVSDSPIIYVSFVVGFPETRSNGPVMSYVIKYGVDPRVPNRNNDQPKLLAPNELGQITLSPENYNVLKNFLASRNHALVSLSKVRLTLQKVLFADGSYWFGNALYRPDPNHPGKYIPVESNQ